jgi:hypothetical protein
MKYSHNQVCTNNGEIEVGKEYDYKESLPTIISLVKVLADTSNEEFIEFELEVIKSFHNFPKTGEKFSVSARRGHYAYGGMWRLWDAGTYTNQL